MVKITEWNTDEPEDVFHHEVSSNWKLPKDMHEATKDVMSP